MALKGTTISVNHLVTMHNGETPNVTPINNKFAYSRDTKRSSRQNKNKEDDPNEEDDPNKEDYPNEEEVLKEKDNSILKKCNNNNKKNLKIK